MVLGLGAPLLVAGLLFHHFLVFFNRFHKYIRMIEIVTGCMLMAVGIMLMFNLMGDLGMLLYMWLPPQS
jgi:cytochrome c-type biogenesis protein